MSLASGSLPPGWIEARIDALVSVNPRLERDGIPDNRLVSFVPMASVAEESGQMDVSRSRPYSEVRKGYTPFLAGDVIMAKITPCMENGKIAVVPELIGGAGFGSTEFHVLRPCDGIEARWLFYFLLQPSFRRAARMRMGGSAGQLRVPADFLAESRVPVAPLPEQRRVVAETEKQFSRLDAGVAALRRVAANLKRYKAAVLKAACDGSLTADWRAAHPDAEPAGVLLRRILTERRRRWEQAELARMLARGKPPKDDRWKARYEEPQGPNPADRPPLPKTWTWATVEQISALLQYGSSAKCSTEGDVPVFRMGNLTNDGRIDTENLKYLPANHDEFPALLLSPGDVLFNRTNSAELVGKSAVYRGEPEQCSFASYLIRVRLMDGAEPVYVAACLNSSLGRNWVKSVVSQQVGQANVNGTKLAAFSLPLPPLDEQVEIAGRIDDSFSVAEHVVGTIDAANRRASRLRQAILRDAFDGKLVPQDPMDEPAAALLERIRASQRSPLRRKRVRTSVRRSASHA
ncbi:MAG: restriction endonuclease subunit S [Planctomycetes bacterium]|nr:restriction endonuclease subunit S [Planctomycetota bacterium]